MIAAVQAAMPVHSHVGRIISGKKLERPYELLLDGDLLILVQELVRVRGPATSAVSKLRGHADEGMVLEGRVRDLHRIGNNLADEAADFGRRWFNVATTDARRALSDGFQFLGICIDSSVQLAGVLLIRMGAAEPLRIPWFGVLELKPKRRRIIEDRLWTGGWQSWPASLFSAADADRWRFSASALVTLASFLSSVYWPSEVADLGNGGSYERWAGERLRIEDSIPKNRRTGRPISVSAAPLCPDADNGGFANTLVA